ncbi:MAG: hypothetical protein OXH41_05890 [Chloroflexi bacterium]|nr:hypothetical protein [Chloroflexota bacterium]
MLLKRETLEGIAEARITLAFRRWKRPTVRAGGELRTAIGVLAIEAVDAVSESDITEDAAHHAGYPGRDALLADLNRRPDGDLYRVALHLAGDDPRTALRQQDTLDGDAIEAIAARLARFDRSSRHGPWTETILRLIETSPGVRAPDLAASLDRETQPFKRDVRKLKELGLTESLKVGYRLSPRGRAWLATRPPER